MRSVASMLVLLVLCVVPGARADEVAPNEVRLCEHIHYLGLCYSFFLESGMRHRLASKLPSALHKKASSIMVGTGVSAVVFDGAFFSGNYSLFYLSDDGGKGGFKAPTHPALDWNDSIASLIVARKGEYYPQGALFVVKGAGGWLFLPLPEQSTTQEARFPSLPFHNDSFTHVRLWRGVEVTLYEHANFKGQSLALPGDSGLTEFDLEKYEMDNRVSSVIIRVPGGAPQAQTPPTAATVHIEPPRRGGEAAGEPHRAPPAVPGLRYEATPVGSVTLEPNSNRPGQDYRDFDLPQARPELCRDACVQDAKCRAFSYIKPGIQGSSARCWLKHGVPPAEHAPCCASGVKQ